MVTNFEEITSELTNLEEQAILPLVIASWEVRSPQKREVIKMSEMVSKINEYCKKFNIYNIKRLKNGEIKKSNKPYTTTGPRMRKIIHHIRTRGYITDLIATKDGYFRTDNKDEIASFIKSCRERANSFNEVAEAMEVYNFER